MIATDLVIYIGSVATIMVAVILMCISRGHWFCKYGREGLMCGAVQIALLATLRIVVIFGFMDSYSSRLVAGISSVVCLAILVQIARVHSIFHTGDSAHTTRRSAFPR